MGDQVPIFNENFLPFKGEVRYFPRFFNQKECEYFLDKLINQVDWVQEPIWMFGKKVMQPRLTSLYGSPSIPYGYSGITMKVVDWSEFLIEIKQRVESIAEIEFTHVLLNYYRNGQDSMGWHRDNEKVLGSNPTIASVSFGVSREFQFRNYSDKSLKKSILLEDGSLLLMAGETQHYWEHQLPKRKKTEGERINLTFRKLVQ